MGKRRRAREMAIQMLYQQDLGGSPLAQVFASFDLDGYREETDNRPASDLPPVPQAADPETVAPETVIPESVSEAVTDAGNGSSPTPSPRAGAEEAFAHARRLVEGTLACREAIDEQIRRHAENWRLERMPTIDRNILRLAVYEMMYEEGVPKVVVVDEAIELAKKFGSEDSGRFVNGLLDGILHGHGEELVATPGGRES